MPDITRPEWLMYIFFFLQTTDVDRDFFFVGFDSFGSGEKIFLGSRVDVREKRWKTFHMGKKKIHTHTHTHTHREDARQGLHSTTMPQHISMILLVSAQAYEPQSVCEARAVVPGVWFVQWRCDAGLVVRLLRPHISGAYGLLRRPRNFGAHATFSFRRVRWR